MASEQVHTEDGTSVIKMDPYLEAFREPLKHRFAYFKRWLEKLESGEPGGLEAFSRGYERFGLNYSVAEQGIWYREWAPNAKEAYLIGDFNGWNRNSHRMKRIDFGVWEIFVANTGRDQPAIPHNSKVKISMVLSDGGTERCERVPVWIKRVVQDPTVNPAFDAVFWNPPETYRWKHTAPRNPPTDLRIYEAHVGISSSEGKICTYREFTQNIIPRIKQLGYNCIQLMAIMEHPYYASFGYQVTSFFAASSRFGTPEELKELIDTAHGAGLYILLDLVHSHASKNVVDGINEFDGTDHLYFHEGARGRHDLWDSRLFNYGHYEVLRFLLSNVRFWLDEYRFDGFRFDGVTSMLYKHHGIAYGFSGGYHEYFSDLTDIEAVGYLMLANYMIHKIRPNAITIAEDVSGMPTLCRPVTEGGVGFDFRLAMAIPDMWIKMLKEHKDEDWDVGFIVFNLTNRRWQERAIAYAESHDQALVGDKSLAFWLMDKEMYEYMSDISPKTPVIERGIALHKIIRLLTYGLGGEGYLNFEGNEFGHPEWLDFPRAGNNSSFHYCRRQFNLVDDQLLRYKYLYRFDAAMHRLEDEYKWLIDREYVSRKHDEDKVIVFERGGLLWIFNLHTRKSFTDYKIGSGIAGPLCVLLNTDNPDFMGNGLVAEPGEYLTYEEGWDGRKYSLKVYIPCRSALVLGPRK